MATFRLRAPFRAPSGGGSPLNQGPPGLARQLANPGSRGQNARYDVSGLRWDEGRGAYTDGVYFYDAGGLSLDRPDSHLSGLPAADADYMAWWAQNPGGGGGGGGGGGSALFGSPYYQQVLAAVNAAAAADAAGRRQGVQQAVIGFGLVPENFADKYGDIDALTRQLAEKNTASGVSTHARLLQARSDAVRQFSRGLAAKGLRRSGAKGFGLRRRQLEYDQNYSDALSKLLGYTGSLYSQFAQNEYSRALALAQAASFASQSYDGGGGGGGNWFTPDPSRPVFSQVYEPSPPPTSYASQLKRFL